MKNIIKLPAIVMGLMLLLTGATQKVMAQDEDVSMQSFYDELSPYGTWIQDAQYGYVWRPNVEQAEFRPYYTNGHWVMTEYGNTWVSNYDWGWGPFHYGRWVYNRYSQWVWIPDTIWGPAWVSWRSGGGYYGWAPMGPGMNINVNFNIPDLWWVFVPQRNIYYNGFSHYYSRRNVTIIHNTTIINNVYTRNRRTYYTGPRIDEVRRETRQNVPIYSVNRTSRPSRTSISGNKVDVYTPSRPSRGSSNANAAPKNVVRGEGYATARPERVSAPTTTTRPTRTGTSGTANGNTTESTRPTRTGTAPTTPVQQTTPQRETQGTAAPARPQRQEQPQAQPQRQAQPQPRPQQQAQPKPQPQAQPQRVEPSRPARSSGGSSAPSRPSRSGRG